MIITDLLGNTVNLLPIVLIEGEEVAPVTLRIYPAEESELLRAEDVPEATILGRVLGIGDFQDLAQEPLDISQNYPLFLDVEIKAELAPGVAGVVRRSVFLGASLGSPAAWTL